MLRELESLVAELSPGFADGDVESGEAVERLLREATRARGEAWGSGAGRGEGGDAAGGRDRMEHALAKGGPAPAGFEAAVEGRS